MGSFNQSCALTGCTISPGDRVVTVLGSGPYPENPNTITLESRPGSNLVTFEKDISIIIPKVVGTYDDYGILNWNLYENPHLISFEKRFDLNYFFNQDHSDNKRTETTQTQWPNGLFVIWMHEYAWNQVLTADIDFMRGYGLPDTVLENLGFVFLKYETEISNNTIWTHPQWPNHHIKSSRGYISIVETATGRVVNANRTLYAFPIYNLNTFYQTLDKCDLFKPSLTLPLYTLILKQLAQDALKEEETYRKIFPEDTKYIVGSWRYLTQDQELNENFIHLWRDLLVAQNPHVETAIAETTFVKRFFFLAGKNFLPTVAGPQCGELKASQILGNIITNLTTQLVSKKQ